MEKSLETLRHRIRMKGLLEADADPDPIRQFRAWFDDALSAELEEPTAMVLATCNSEGQPSARTVLLKELDDQGFVFFTNLDSRKGKELKSNPRASLVFLWLALERQVRVEGWTALVSVEESVAYFKTRPRASQIGAWASPQSEVISSRQELDHRVQDISAKYPEGDLPLPNHWGGMRVHPEMIEFWQGRPSRLHDRLRYRKGPSGIWIRDRLAP